MEPPTSGAAAFRVVWAALVDLLGTSATASLVRRAARQGAPRYPELEQLAVTRDALDYRFQLPPSWATAERPPALHHLVRQQLFPLLRVLTGDVVVRRLERLPEVRDAGLSSEVDDA